MKISQRIRSWLQEGEDILTSLLGLIIAISGLIAFADVFSSGRALAYVPWLLWVWIVTQAIAVDYQFYITVKRQFTAQNVDRLVYSIRWILIAVLGALVVFVGAIFAVNETQGGTMAASMSVLGIPTIAFMYARAVSPVLLLFVIAVDHALDRKEQPAQPAPTINPDVLNVLVERLDQLHVTVTQLTNPSMQALTPLAESRASETPLIERLEPSQMEMHVPSQFASKEQEVAAVLARSPGASIEQIAQEAGCNMRTAEKWMKKLQEHE